MLKIRLSWVRRTSLLAIFFSALGLHAAFDAEGARVAIDSFTQALASAKIAGVGDSLAKFDAQLAAATQSGYAADTELAAAIANAQADLSAIRSALSTPPNSSDVDELEAAYGSYIGGIESLRLQADLNSLQTSSDEALSAAAAMVQELIDAFKEAQGFVVENDQPSQSSLTVNAEQLNQEPAS